MWLFSQYGQFIQKLQLSSYFCHNSTLRIILYQKNNRSRGLTDIRPPGRRRPAPEMVGRVENALDKK